MILEDQPCSHHRRPKQSEENRGIRPYPSKTETDFDWPTDGAGRYHCAFFRSLCPRSRTKWTSICDKASDRCTYLLKDKLQDINMKIGHGPTLTAANQSRTLDVYFCHVLRNAEKSYYDRTMIAGLDGRRIDESYLVVCGMGKPLVAVIVGDLL